MSWKPGTHHYEVEVTWTGNTGEGTGSYKGFERAHDVTAGGKAPIAGSADPAFRGVADRWNPEEMLVAAVSQCHMLWYLHLCVGAGIVVTAYTDRPRGTMVENADASGAFSEVVLRPRMTITDPGRAEEAVKLHERAHEMCFIANSVAFPIRHEPEVVTPG